MSSNNNDFSKEYGGFFSLSVNAGEARGGYFRNFSVGMCRWDPETLNLY